MKAIPVGVCAFVFGFAMEAGAASNLQELEELRNRLTSPVEAESKKGEGILNREGKAIVERSIDLVEKSAREGIGTSARSLRIMMSPWARGMERSKASRGNMRLPFPERPVARSVDHPSAERAAKVLYAALHRLIEQTKVKPSETEVPIYFPREAYKQVCEALAEVADIGVLDQLAPMLEKSDDTQLREAILIVFETYYSLPQGFQSGGLCGLATPAEVKRFHNQEAKMCSQVADEILDWHAKYKESPQKERLEAALGKWDARLENYVFKNYAYYHRGWEWEKLEPLIRAGDAILPLLEKRKSESTDMNVKGNYEVVHAAITGKEDKKLVRALLDSQDPSNKTLEAAMACEIIAAARSTDWFEDLKELQHRKYYKQDKASWTLAVCHGEKSIPALKEAFKRNSGNISAKYAVPELEARRNRAQ